MKALRIILLGPPGAGKGTQAVFIAEKAGIPHISTGEILRNAVNEGSELGMQAKAFMDKGELVPDEVLIGLIRDRLQQTDCEKGFLLDGYPRNVDQAKALDVLLLEIDKEATHVIELKVSEEVLIDRIKKRGEMGSGRSDDTVEVATKRLQVYWEQTAPVSKHYTNAGKIVEVDGLGTIEEVQQRVLAIIT